MNATGVNSCVPPQHCMAAPQLRPISTTHLPFYTMLQGRELEAEVQESKLYSDRLAALEADLEELRLAEAEARSRHQKHLAELEPLANRHKHHRVRAPARG